MAKISSEARKEDKGNIMVPYRVCASQIQDPFESSFLQIHWYRRRYPYNLTPTTIKTLKFLVFGRYRWAVRLHLGRHVNIHVSIVTGEHPFEILRGTLTV